MGQNGVSNANVNSYSGAPLTTTAPNGLTGSSGVPGASTSCVPWRSEGSDSRLTCPAGRRPPPRPLPRARRRLARPPAARAAARARPRAPAAGPLPTLPRRVASTRWASPPRWALHCLPAPCCKAAGAPRRPVGAVRQTALPCAGELRRAVLLPRPAHLLRSCCTEMPKYTSASLSLVRMGGVLVRCGDGPSSSASAAYSGPTVRAASDGFLRAEGLSVRKLAYAAFCMTCAWLAPGCLH
jgi:hypothetical protein